MYPRNAASPERIAVGQVVLIADGTVQTSGVSIVVRPQGGAEGAGGGTTAYGADGTVYYTPTQAETNYTSFVVIAYKASCFSVSQTIITTASSTAGTVDVYSVGGTAQTANDNGVDINAILVNTNELQTNQGNWVTATGFATATELAKVPKSDGTATWNATALASINAEADTAISDAALATAASLATAQDDLDKITGSDGVTLATAQGNYAPNTVVPDAAGTAATPADVATALGTYDGPTNAEMVAAFTEIKGATWVSGTDTLEAIRDRGDTAWVTATGFATEAKQDIIDTVVDAVKAKTDQLTFTKANELDANTKSINGITITGDGSTTPFDV